MSRRSVALFEDIDTLPLRQWELDLALCFIDNEYEDQVSPDLLRIVFDTVQHRRSISLLALHDIVREVTNELVRESFHKQNAVRAGIGKVNSNRRLMKEKHQNAIYSHEDIRRKYLKTAR